jgi:hypothetical protein
LVDGVRERYEPFRAIGGSFLPTMSDQAVTNLIAVGRVFEIAIFTRQSYEREGRRTP